MAERHGEPSPRALSELTEIEAAGAVVWRRGPDGPEVLLIHRPRRDDWSLAKGKREPGEHLPETAVREVMEETGVRPVLGRRLNTVRYLAGGRPKRVDYWAAAAPAPRGAPAGFVPNDEVDAVRWLLLPRAYQQLSYAADVSVLDEFARCPHRTVPFLVVRHAPAGHKNDWSGDDLLRPLDFRGQAEARSLVPLLSCFGPVRVVSSPAARCLATVEPYAAHIGAPVLAEPAFMVRDRSSFPDGLTVPPDLVSAVTGLLADGVPTVVCAHRENIPEIVSVACRWLGAPPPEDPSLPKTGFWVLQAAESMLAGMERYDLSGLWAGAWSWPVSAGAAWWDSASACPVPAALGCPVSAAAASAAPARARRSRRCLRTRTPISTATATASAISTYSEYRVICV